jgi:cytosine/adenosine deaminase-related metal-dependent hydrolase
MPESVARLKRLVSVLLRARWVLPITSPPIRDAWVLVRKGRIVELGGGPPPSVRLSDTRDLGHSALLPGLVNAHTHLELSWLWGKVPPAQTLPDWVGTLLTQRAAAATDDVAAIRQAIVDAEEAGTAAVADVSNTLASVAPLAASRLHAVVFRELIGFNPLDAASLVAQAAASLDAVAKSPRLRLHLAPHAPYSVAPAVIAAIAAAAGSRRAPMTIHLAESPEETEFLRTGRGRWRELLDARGVWNPVWQPPDCGAVEYLDRLGALGARTLAVHGVQCTDADLGRLAARGATLVTCPRSNVWVGVGPPPASKFFASGVRVALGTDSLASGTDLNLFSEVSALHFLAPEVPAATLLHSATRAGALALGLEGLGAIEPRKLARLITVDLPLGIQDVEQYLVEGVDPSQIAWAPVA